MSIEIDETDEAELLKYLDKTLPITPTRRKCKDTWVLCPHCKFQFPVRTPIVVSRKDVESFKELLGIIQRHADKELHTSQNMLKELLESVYHTLLEEKRRENNIEDCIQNCQSILAKMESEDI